MNASEVLRRARKLIERKGGWCQNVFARSKSGHPTGWDEHDACSFCASAAIYKVTDGAGSLSVQARAFLTEAIERIQGGLGLRFNIPEWNDYPLRQKSAVVAAFKLAEKLAKEAEKAEQS